MEVRPFGRQPPARLREAILYLGPPGRDCLLQLARPSESDQNPNPYRYILYIVFTRGGFILEINKLEKKQTNKKHQQNKEQPRKQEKNSATKHAQAKQRATKKATKKQKNATKKTQTKHRG